MNTITKRTQGMNWIRKEKRLALYLRDGLACVYCSKGIEDGEQLTLDHLKPYSKGGSHDATNLVTCCMTCNRNRGTRAVTTFVRSVAEYARVEASEILAHVRRCAARKIDVASAKQMMDRRGGFTRALRG